MQNDGSIENGVVQLDLGKQSLEGRDLQASSSSSSDLATRVDGDPTVLTVVISNGDSFNQICSKSEPELKISKTADSTVDVVSPKKVHLSRNISSHEQCRVCQQENEENLIDLGCQCRGGLAKAHKSCIETWFRTRGSNRCEICQELAVNVLPPESQPPNSYWVWRVDPVYGSTVAQERQRLCYSPLWIAFSILVGGLLLDVLISITLGVSALPINIIIGVIVILGLGTALRLAVEVCHEWSVRRVFQRGETNVNVNLGYHPAL